MWFRTSAIIINITCYLKSFTTKRLINLVKLFGGYFFSRIVRKPVWITYPFALSIESSGFCQLQCPECPTGAAVLSREKGHMNLELFNKIIYEIKDYTFYLNLYFQGEPLLHPQIDKIISMAAKNRFYTTLSTNAQLIDKSMSRKIVASGLSRIIISLDGFSQEVYERYRRGGKVDKVKNAILRLIEAKKKAKSPLPLVVVQSLAFTHNKHEIPSIKEWCKATGVDKLEIKTAQINEFGDGSVKPDPQKSRYKNSSNPANSIPGTPYNHCWRQWSNPVITWDGQMVPCCYDKDAKYSLGNISNKTFNEIWQKNESKQFKHTILSFRNNIEMCRNCPEGRQWFFN